MTRSVTLMTEMTAKKLQHVQFCVLSFFMQDIRPVIRPVIQFEIMTLFKSEKIYFIMKYYMLAL
jgi:hypothetical protein